MSSTALQEAQPSKGSRPSSGEAGRNAQSSSATSSRKVSNAASGEDETMEDDTQAQATTNEEVSALMSEVRASMAEQDDIDPDESRDEVKVSDHLDMAHLTLDDKDEASSNTSSASNSVAASPAIAASSSDTSSASHAKLAEVPPVELKDGGNASIPEEGSAIGKKDFFDVRIAVVGNVDSGKSTLIGVLTGGALDDGRGKARSKVFIHAHELGTGRTSAISQHIMGFDAAGKPVHQAVAASAQSAAKSKSWANVIAASKSIVTFTDLAGHERYLKTTIAGLTGSHPDYAFVIINSLAGVTKMTREHLGVVLALEIPLICIVTKVDLVPTPVLEASKKQLFRILKSSAANKLPIQMRNEKDIETVLANSENSNKICPVFFISAVNGTHVGLLTTYLSRLRPHLEWLQQYANGMVTHHPDGTRTTHPTACEFSIDEVFNVSGVGIVVSGTLNSGTLNANSTLLLGPHSDGSWIQVLVRSLHYKRVSCASVDAGQSCAVSIRAVKRKETLKRNLIRRGMVLVDPVVQPSGTRIFDAEVLILHHPTTIKLGYQAVLHCGMIRQTAQIVRIQKACLRTGDKSTCRFRFLLREEYLHVGAAFVFREGSTKGIGKVTRVTFSKEEKEELEAEELQRKKHGGGSQGPGKAAGGAGGASASSSSAGKKDGENAAGEEDADDIDDAPQPVSKAKAAAAQAAAAAAAAATSSASSSSSKAAADAAREKTKWSNKEKQEYHSKQQKHGGGGAGEHK